jgi:Tol biopolymer transport system component
VKTFVILAALLASAAADAAPALVSDSTAGNATGNAGSRRPRISADGRRVAFESTATNLVSGVFYPGAAFNVFERDLVPGTTTLVSRADDQVSAGNGKSYDALPSADGRYVAFSSFATNLVAAPDGNFDVDVFLRDTVAGVTTRLSTNAAGTDSGNNASEVLAISADGRVVVFASYASNLTALADTNNDEDIFAYDRSTGRSPS